MAARHWTPEQRQGQREVIKNWKPWSKSTGPVSPEGKAVVSRNGWKGGHRAMLRQLTRELHQALRDQRAYVGN